LKQKGIIFSGTAETDSSAVLSQRLGKLLALADPLSADSSGKADRKALDQRMRALQSALERRRDMKKNQAQQQTKSISRRQLLINAVGVQKAQLIIALVREIRVLRLRRRDLLGSAALKKHQPIVCTRGGCSVNVYSLQTSAEGKLPTPVKDIFFNTALVDALERTPEQHFGKLPWDDLYSQGMKHVQTYRAWLKETEGARQEGLAHSPLASPNNQCN
jgi:hypothetical protein